MTKLEILENYTPTQRRDSWAIMGGLYITDTSRVYTKNSIYRLNCTNCSLNGALVFCLEEYQGYFQWENAKLADSTTGEISFGNNIISPYFALILTSEEYDSIVVDVSTTFIPFQDDVSSDSIIIPDDEYELILSKSGIGYPFVTETELEYSREDIINLCLKPSLQEYFKWFPKEETICQYCNSDLQKIPYPTDAYGIIAASIQQGGSSGTNGVTNTLLRYWDELGYGQGFSGVSGRYMGGYRKPQTNTSTTETLLSSRAAMQGIINYRTRVHVETVIEDGIKYAQLYSTKLGEAQVTFAIKSSNWNDINFNRINDVRKYAAAAIKILFGSLRSQVKSDIPGNPEKWNQWEEEGKKDQDEVIEVFKDITKFSGVMRGGL